MPLIRNRPDAPAQATAGEAEKADLAAGLASASADSRWLAARTAAAHPEGAALLAEALAGEADIRVREAIFSALVEIATPESVAAILPFLRCDDAGLRSGALDALRAMPEAVSPVVRQLLADPDSDVRILACDLLRDAADASSAALLCALLEEEPEANVCAAAIDVLAGIGDASALPHLSRCAERFPADPFLAFATKIAVQRLRSTLSEAT